MSSYIDFEYDFIERTLTDIKKYHGDYEVTALVNGCVGLLIIPKENLFNQLPDVDVSSYGIDLSKIQVNDKYRLPYSLKNILRHIRNSIAHGNFNQEDSSGSIIRSLRFQDFKKVNEQKIMTFEMIIDVYQFRDFAIRVASEVLSTKQGDSYGNL